MAGYVMGIQLDIAKAKQAIWDALDEHGDDPAIRSTLTRVGRLIDDIGHTAANQREIIQKNGLSSDEATVAELEALLTKLKGTETR